MRAVFCTDSLPRPRATLGFQERSPWLALVPYLHDRFHERGFRLSAYQLHLVVQNDFGHCRYRVALSQVGKLTDLNDIRRNVLTFDGHLVRQPGDGGTVRSHGRRKDLYVHVFFECTQCFPASFAEGGRAF